MVDFNSKVHSDYRQAVDGADKAVDTRPAGEAGAAEKEEAAASTAPKVDTYEPSKGEKTEEVTYKPNTKLVEQLKAEQAQLQARFINTVRQALGQQGAKIGESDEAFWKFIASGEYTVDADTKAAAQQAISEDGYWGVKQTSERLVGFAKALVGGDPSRVEEMRAAFQKGFDEAAKVWGGALPDITKDTYDAVMDLFDQWAKEGSAAAETGAGAEADAG